MFTKSNRRKTRTDLTVTAEDGSILYQGPLQALPVRESLVLARCIEYFDDHDPCFIHRTAAANRLLLELEDHLRLDSAQGLAAVRAVFATECPVGSVMLDLLSTHEESGR